MDNIDWASLEDHVANGVFSPPMKEEDGRIVIRRGGRRGGSSVLLNATVPTTLFIHNSTSSTHKTTTRQLREYPFNTLITLRDEATGEETEYRLRQVVRNGPDWRTMKFVDGRGNHLVVFNTTDPVRSLQPQVQVDDISIVQDGLRWIAEFKWSEANKRSVQRAGFTFSPTEKVWDTRDPKVAAVFDQSIRSKLEVQRRSTNTAAPDSRKPRRRIPAASARSSRQSFARLSSRPTRI